jgi:hypothetical protein
LDLIETNIDLQEVDQFETVGLVCSVMQSIIPLLPKELLTGSKRFFSVVEQLMDKLVLHERNDLVFRDYFSLYVDMSRDEPREWILQVGKHNLRLLYLECNKSLVSRSLPIMSILFERIGIVHNLHRLWINDILCTFIAIKENGESDSVYSSKLFQKSHLASKLYQILLSQAVKHESGLLLYILEQLHNRALPYLFQSNSSWIFVEEEINE